MGEAKVKQEGPGGGGAFSKLRSMFGRNASAGGGPRGKVVASNAAVQELLKDHSCPLWALLLQHTRALAAQQQGKQ